MKGRGWKEKRKRGRALHKGVEGKEMDGVGRFQRRWEGEETKKEVEEEEEEGGFRVERRETER